MKMEIRDYAEVQILEANGQDWQGASQFAKFEGRLIVVANFDDSDLLGEEKNPMIFFWIPGVSSEEDAINVACSWFCVTEDECNFPDFL